jgi:hypothetical protein
MEKHPVAFLLILCDEIQEWFRPTGDDIESGKNFMQLLSDFKFQMTDDSIFIYYQNQQKTKELIDKVSRKLDPCIVKLPAVVHDLDKDTEIIP